MDELKLINKCEKSFIEDYADMDVNMSLYNLDSYTMKDYKGEAVPRVDNVTLPGIATFADRVMTISGGVIPQIKVKSKKMEDEQKVNVQNFLYGAFDEANALLSKMGRQPFHTKLAEYGALKKLVALRVIVSQEGEKVRFSLIPIDPRYLTYRMGVNGLIWAAPKMTRDAEDIFSEYGEEIKGDTADVLDFWNSEENVVYIKGKEVLRQTNEFGYPPFVIIPIDNSIYKNIKSIYNEMNKTATILKSTSIQSLRAAMQIHTHGRGDDAGYPESGSVTQFDPDEPGFRAVQMPDVHQATAFIWQIESSEFQRGSYAYIEYGGLEFPLSSLAIGQLKEGRDQILFPLLMALTSCYRQTCDMMIKQFKAGKFKAELGEDELISTYAASDLPDPGRDCNIKFVFKTTVVAEQGAAYQMANIARDWLDEDTIREEILKVDNAKEMSDKVWAERAFQLYPELAQYRMAEALKRLGKKDEVLLMNARLESPEMEEPAGQIAKRPPPTERPATRPPQEERMP